MHNLAWSLYRRKGIGLVLVVVFMVSYLVVLYVIGAEVLDMQGRDWTDVTLVSQGLCAWLHDPKKCEPILIAILVPVVTTLMAGGIGLLLPLLVTVALFPEFRRVVKSCKEKGPYIGKYVKGVLKGNIEKAQERATTIDMQGTEVATSELPVFTQAVLDPKHPIQSPRKMKLSMTTLKPIDQLAMDPSLVALTVQIVHLLEPPVPKGRPANSRLRRFFVCDNAESILDLSKHDETTGAAIKQLIRLHTRVSASLFYVSPAVLRAAADRHAINQDMLDVLMFDGGIVFGYKNDPETLQLLKFTCYGQPTYTLFAKETRDVVDSYTALMDDLKRCCEDDDVSGAGDIMKLIERKRWHDSYFA